MCSSDGLRLKIKRKSQCFIVYHKISKYVLWLVIFDLHRFDTGFQLVDSRFHLFAFGLSILIFDFCFGNLIDIFIWSGIDRLHFIHRSACLFTLQEQLNEIWSKSFRFNTCTRLTRSQHTQVVLGKKMNWIYKLNILKYIKYFKTMSTQFKFILNILKYSK